MNCPNMNGTETAGVMPIDAIETYSLAAALVTSMELKPL